MLVGLQRGHVKDRRRGATPGRIQEVEEPRVDGWVDLIAVGMVDVVATAAVVLRRVLDGSTLLCCVVVVWRTHLLGAGAPSRLCFN